MKRFIYLFVLGCSLSLVSCKKEVIKPTEDVPPQIEQIPIFGDWLLLSGKMYMTNLETGKKTVYNHFDSDQNVSSLRYGGYAFELERIVQDSTVWSFRQPLAIPGMGQFWLNYDSIQPYGFYVTNSSMRITEYTSGEQQLGGSARPLVAYIEDYAKQEVNFYTQEEYASINGNNYKYFSELTFKKQ